MNIKLSSICYSTDDDGDGDGDDVNGQKVPTHIRVYFGIWPRIESICSCMLLLNMHVCNILLRELVEFSLSVVNQTTVFIYIICII